MLLVHTVSFSRTVDGPYAVYPKTLELLLHKRSKVNLYTVLRLVLDIFLLHVVCLDVNAQVSTQDGEHILKDNGRESKEEPRIHY